MEKEADAAIQEEKEGEVDDEESISEDENKEKGVVVIQQFIRRYLAKRRLQKDAERRISEGKGQGGFQNPLT